jgi:hypothetical protein
MAILETFKAYCGRLEEGKGLCFRAEVEKTDIQLANLSIRAHGNWSDTTLVNAEMN